VAEREGARILFSGDTRQIQSVEASDALRILERESQMKSVSLTGVQRQTQAEYRDAIQTLRQAPEQGFQKLEQLGAIREVPYLERPQAVASAYRELTTDPSRKVLVVAGTHEEIGRITHAIREGMKQSGDLGPGKIFERHTPLQWTEAQKKDLSNYQQGQVLLFHRSSHGIARNEALVVERAIRFPCLGAGHSTYANLAHRTACSAPRSQHRSRYWSRPVMPMLSCLARQD
jgi:hypothetical protein